MAETSSGGTNYTGADNRIKEKHNNSMIAVNAI